MFGHQIVDTHVHFWNPSHLEYFWLTPAEPAFLQQTFLPGHLEPERVLAGVTHGVFVQASHDPHENHWILEITKPYPWIAGVVGWLDLTAPNLAAQLEQITLDSRFKGVRHLTHAIQDANWLAREDVNAGLECLAVHGLSVDLVLRPDQLELAYRVIKAHPNLSFILDHMGNPPFSGDLAQWRSDFARLASLPNLVCKISGLLTGFKAAPDLVLLRQTIQFGLAQFGTARVMFGGDHPVSALAAPYQSTIQTIHNALGDITPAEARAFWSDNALRVYRLGYPHQS